MYKSGQLTHYMRYPIIAKFKSKPLLELTQGKPPPMPDYNTYLNRIYEVLQPYVPQGVTLTENSELVADLGLSSIDVMEMIVEIEDHFDISIPLNILPDISTVGDLARSLGKIDQA